MVREEFILKFTAKHYVLIVLAAILIMAAFVFVGFLIIDKDTPEQPPEDTSIVEDTQPGESESDSDGETKPDEPEVIFVYGLYTGDNLIHSWEELIELGYIDNLGIVQEGYEDMLNGLMFIFTMELLILVMVHSMDVLI